MMSSVDLPYLSAGDALAAFRSRELSPVELLDAVLRRAELVEPAINALTTIRRDEALVAAREAEARYRGRGGGEPRALEGLPVGVKEEQAIEGEPLQLGSHLMEGYVADVTHPVIERIIAAGGVVHARTATPEFSSAAFTHTPLWGVTRNPWNTECTPGGSSGGSGAALASGTATLATGSDIGGSIRIPASLCGVVGYKPPYGRVPALPPFNLDAYCHDGPMGRSVADVALLHNVIAGQHPIDQVSLPFPGPVTVDGSPGRIVGRRIAWARTIGDTPVDPEVAAATARVASTLADLGAIVEEVEIPISMEMLFQAAFAHYGAIMGPSVDEVAAGQDERLTPYVRAFRDKADAGFAEVGFYGGLKLESEIDAAVTNVLAPYAAFVCPTMATIGYAADDDYTETRVTVNGVELDFYLQAALTPLFNLLSRRPVLAVPSGIASNGVPTGVQVVGRPYDDATVFDVAGALEAASRWWASPGWRPGAIAR
ncbi:MAG: amidase [Chloroflexi bacterium]|nr:amidase [Chloroflexota bacterium]